MEDLRLDVGRLRKALGIHQKGPRKAFSFGKQYRFPTLVSILKMGTKKASMVSLVA